MKYKIGLPANLAGGQVSVPGSYYEFAQFFDAEVIILPPEHTFREDLDLLILLGGADVNPIRYGGVPTIFTGYPDPTKEYFDMVYLPRYIDAGVPVFGICRGFQTLNVFFGGKLGEVNHPTNSTSDGAEIKHKLFALNSLAIPDFTTPKGFGVNSRHHQGFSGSYKAEDLISLYHYDGIIEAFAHKSLPVVGVQWHPEDIYDDFSIYAISKMLKTRNTIVNERFLSQVTKQEQQLRVVKA